MRIRDRKKSDGDNSYYTVFGCNEMAALISETHATTIANGSELEKLLKKCLEKTSNIVIIKDLVGFFEDIINKKIKPNKNIYYSCTKNAYKDYKKYIKDKDPNGFQKLKKIEPDFLIFNYDKQLSCSVIEMKDGNNFDTKKSEGEFDHLFLVADYFNDIKVKAEYYICGFNTKNIQSLYTGLKGRIERKHLMLGSEFCKTYGLDYEDIRNSRIENDPKDNVNYFVDRILDSKIFTNALFENEKFRTILEEKGYNSQNINSEMTGEVREYVWD